MNILFDRECSQVQEQLKPAGRLNTLFGAIKKQGWIYSIGPDQLSSSALDGVDCLVFLTRIAAFTDPELTAITAFQGKGGGVLLISDHGPLNGDTTNWTTHDRVLAKQCGITINAAGYQMTPPPLTMSGSDFGTSANAQAILENVTSIVPHNSCAVSSASAASFQIANIPSNAFNKSPIFPNGPAGQSYAVGIIGVTSAPNARVIVGGNSGIAGDKGTLHPAPGMIDEGSNLQFLLNCMQWVTAAQ